MKKKAIDLTIRELFEIALKDNVNDARITVNPNNTKQIFLGGCLGGGWNYSKILEYDDLVEVKKVNNND